MTSLKASLRLSVKKTDLRDLIAPPLHPHRMRLMGRKNIDNISAHRIGSPVFDHRDLLIATLAHDPAKLPVGQQIFDTKTKAVPLKSLPGQGPPHRRPDGGDHKARRHRL